MEKYLTVSQLTKYIKFKLENDPHLGTILLKGEISNFKLHSRGHLYFSLKDSEATISAIMFQSDAQNLNFEPKEGAQVLVTGKISLYMPSGQYSIQVTKMELDGIGDLYLQYEKLKKELLEKGYFDQKYKKDIPKYPKVIGVITSKTGAVIEDIKHTVDRRYKLAEIHLYPSLVQGAEAISDLVRNIEKANEDGIADVLIVGRGGGSIEDLWAFNSLEVAMAIFQSKIPVITAIGHETDHTIADLIGDLRAPTPTAAAELATPSKITLQNDLMKINADLQYKVEQIIKDKQTLLVHLDRRLDLQSPLIKVKNHFEKLNDLKVSLNREMYYYIERKKMVVTNIQSKLKSPIDRIMRFEAILNHLSDKLLTSYKVLVDHRMNDFMRIKDRLQSQNPLALMDKGFALVKTKGKIVKSKQDLKLDDFIEVQLKDGEVIAKIKEIR